MFQKKKKINNFLQILDLKKIFASWIFFKESKKMYLKNIYFPINYRLRKN